MNTEKTTWNFVEQYYPNYSTSEEIAESNDLQKIIDGEYTAMDNAHVIAQEIKKALIEYSPRSDKALAYDIPRAAKKRLDFLSKAIYKKAIEGYFEALKNVTVDNSHIVMPLSISDVDQVMEDNDIDYPLTEYGKIKVLEDCRDNFDANATYWDNLLESVNRIIEQSNNTES